MLYTVPEQRRAKMYRSAQYNGMKTIFKPFSVVIKPHLPKSQQQKWGWAWLTEATQGKKKHSSVNEVHRITNTNGSREGAPEAI